VVSESYPTIAKTLGTPVAIDAADMDQIVMALSCEHSFFDRRRYFRGGHKTHVQAFRDANTIERVRSTLKYLLHGTDPFVDRMGRCIFNPAYKLGEFGRSAVQELLGWINGEGVPICNSRTLKALRWLGFETNVGLD